MKHLLWVSLVFLISCAGCLDSKQGCVPLTPQSEEAQILAYANANGIAAVKHNSGLYYEVLNPGTGPTPTISSRVFITYTGKLLNGTQFDQATNPAQTGWPLGSLIEGWQIGMPLIKKGGRIKLIIPSSLAYGCNGVGTIPPNSVLFFDINLVDVQ